ncbi:TonB family protein [Caulobacter sp.]|jgi:protein TonB|uniref:energy transducer TonB family protein n=1 Tax=Caulobacter sp. TaxID=78 RepID=UPI0031D9EF4B
MNAAALLATERWCRRVLLPKGAAFVSSCGIVAAQLALVTFERSPPPLAPAAPDIVVTLVSPDLVMPPPVPLRPAPSPAAKAQRDPRPADEPKPAKLAKAETTTAAAPVQASAPALDDRIAPTPMPASFVTPAAAPVAAKAPPPTEDTALKAYQEQVWRMIMARRPPGARLTGGAMIGFHLMANGAPCDIEIVRTSGDPMLDRLALDTVKRAGPFPKPPAGVDAATRFQIRFQFG